MTKDFHRDKVRDLRHCPTTLGGNALQRSYRGDLDAAGLVADIRDVDLQQIWGRIYSWIEESPARATAAMISLAAHLDTMPSPDRSPEWTRDFGGMAALHLDFNRRVGDRRQGGGKRSAFREAVQALVAEGSYTDAQIAVRVGCTEKTVANYRIEMGIRYQAGRKSNRADKIVAEFEGQGLSTEQIAEASGLSESTVLRAKQRLAAAAEEAVDERAAPGRNGAAA